MQQDPFAPKYGNTPQQPMPQPMYGGMPVQAPRKGLNVLLIPLVLSMLLLSGSIIFGIWAYLGMQDYKNNIQPKIEDAVAIAEQEISTAKDVEFQEKEKSPVREYKAPQSAGSIVINYPKTWSAYVTEDEKASNPVDGYFHPSYVPSTTQAQTNGTDYALRVKVLNQSYAEVMKQFESTAKSGKVSISPYKAPKMPDGVIGARIVGEINTGQQDNMVMFPLRDKTIQISTESVEFLGDFNDIILANLTFVP